uniref:Uncharacterized protein n=1 Tax=viral metagenome TaxID=1070528 RepID=A0A6M3JF15_9ZZZZ
MAVRIMAVSAVSKEFRKAYTAAEIPLTRRQWKKWRRKIGKAYRLRQQATTE